MVRSKPNGLSTKQYIYNQLKERIVFLDLKPGETISEAKLIEELGVSRTPVREALLRLSDELLVYSLPQSGTFVSKIDLEYIKQLVLMRHILEQTILLELCKHKMDLSDQFAENLFMQNLAVQKNDVRDFIAWDNEFHRILFSIAGSEHIWQVIENSRTHHTRFRMLDLMLEGNQMESYNEHLMILDCIKTGDSRALKKCLKEHHDCDLREKDLIMSQFPTYFGPLRNL